MILTQYYTLILALDVHDNSVKVRNCFEISVYSNCIFCENTAEFHKFMYYDKLIAGYNFMGIKHQNQGINSGHNLYSQLCGGDQFSAVVWITGADYGKKLQL